MVRITKARRLSQVPQVAPSKGQQEHRDSLVMDGHLSRFYEMYPDFDYSLPHVFDGCSSRLIS